MIEQRERIHRNLEKISNELDECERNIHLVAVSKYSPVEDIEAAYLYGQRDFGENRIQDLKIKSEKLAHLIDINWHFQGSIQSNKVKSLLEIPHLRYIHSVDSLKTAMNLLNRAKSSQKSVESEYDQILCFVQVNTSNEKEKSGVRSVEEVLEIINEFKSCDQSLLKLYGLMTMGSIRSLDQLKSAEECFLKLNHMSEALQNHYGVENLKLSMGMSADYQIAIKHGADFVRIGSSLFKTGLP